MDMERTVRDVRNMGLPAEKLESFLYGNAAKLFWG
jgi:predicted TIM-barrel fold metal-dependent hydrolase